jgi:hypothetical protein
MDWLKAGEEMIKIYATQLEKSRSRGEEIVPTLAQRLIDEGRRRGMQQGLMMQLSTRFHLNEDEKQLISAVNELEKLTAALKLVITAQTKEEVLQSLKAVRVGSVEEFQRLLAR